MYLPYLRGKQFELLALRELCLLPLSSNKISPIIEPLKKDFKSVQTVLKALYKNSISAQLIVNPQYGDLTASSDDVFSFIEDCRKQGLTNIVPTYLISNLRDFSLFKNSVYKYKKTGYSLIHLNKISNEDELRELTKNTSLIFNIIHVNHLIALQRSYSSVAFLSDPFNKKKRNVDYLDNDDEVFSSDYCCYSNEGYTSFSDYLTIGSDYTEGGMLPIAVVIHFTYKDPFSDDIRIRHFVSDNNKDTSDTAGKFGEALEKLINFIDTQNIRTIASEQFRDYHNRGAFPGLGVVKKLSIMHHIELIQSLI